MPVDQNLFRELWEQGVSSAEMGRMLGMSGKGVRKKARRMNLPMRAHGKRQNPNPSPYDHRSVWELPEDQLRAAITRRAAMAAREALEAAE